MNDELPSPSFSWIRRETRKRIRLENLLQQIVAEIMFFGSFLCLYQRHGSLYLVHFCCAASRAWRGGKRKLRTQTPLRQNKPSPSHSPVERSWTCPPLLFEESGELHARVWISHATSTASPCYQQASEMVFPQWLLVRVLSTCTRARTTSGSTKPDLEIEWSKAGFSCLPPSFLLHLFRACKHDVQAYSESKQSSPHEEHICA